MRKVFMSMMLLQEAKPTEYISEDFNLVKENFVFPLTYIIAENVVEGETITVITGVERQVGNFQQSVENYKLYQEEVKKVVEQRNAEVEFVEFWLEKDFDSLTFNKFFKKVAGSINEGDVVYIDITFGMKPYTISLFVALNYVAKVCNDVEIENVIYAQKYSGSEKPENVNKSIIYDLSGLFHLNELAGNVRKGDRAVADRMLDFIIGGDK